MNKRDERLVLLCIVLFWLVSALFHVSGSVYLTWLAEKPVLFANLASEMRHWLYYIFLAPLCLWLPRRFPIRRDVWARTLLVVAAIGIAASAVLAAVELTDAYLMARLQERPWSRTISIWKISIWGGYSNWLTYAMTSGLVYALHHFRQAQTLEREAAQHALRVTELERSLVSAQLRALQTQLQPHFIFNTHHAINGLIMKGETEKAVRMLTQLSDLLRLTLEQRTTPVVSLRYELELLQYYLEIQQTRFGGRLQVDFDVAEETLTAQVPSLILQPLVENGIKHGVEKHAQPGSLRISAVRRNGQLTLAVENSGPAVQQKSSTANDGIGLSTTRERLRQLFGDEQRFELCPMPTGGMRAELTIPFRIALGEAVAAVHETGTAHLARA